MLLLRRVMQQAQSQCQAEIPNGKPSDMSVDEGGVDGVGRKRIIAADFERANHFWRAENFIAKASMDEQGGKQTAADANAWGVGGEQDNAAEAEVLDNLLSHGVVEDMRC